MFGEHTGELKRGQAVSKGNFTKEGASDRDRFGNQLFSSKEFKYLNNVGKETAAGILISPEGQSFIAANPRILQDIEKGLISFETTHGNMYRTIDLGPGRSLECVPKLGSQSTFYILRINEKKYAIKTHKTEIPEGATNISQPYIDEMLQTQAVAIDLKDQLNALHVEMATFLFASSQVSCTKYEEEHRKYYFFTREILTKLFEMVDDYIKTKRATGEKVWDKVRVDYKGNMETIARNFITQEDGTLVWIDPFVYDENIGQFGNAY